MYNNTKIEAQSKTVYTYPLYLLTGHYITPPKKVIEHLPKMELMRLSNTPRALVPMNTTTHKSRAWMYTRVALGYHHGPCPQGYYIVKDHDGRTNIRQDGNFKFMSRMFSAYATGEYSDVELTSLMNKYGFRTTKGKPMTGSKMRRLLRNPMYVGKVKDIRKGVDQYYEGRWAAATDKDTFRRVQDLLKARGHKYCNASI